MSNLKSIVRSLLPGHIDHYLVKSLDQTKLAAESAEKNVDYSKLFSVDRWDQKQVFQSNDAEQEWLDASRLLFDLISPVGIEQHKAKDQQTKGLKPPGGWCNIGDRRAIYHLIRHFKPQSVLEVGTYVGSSTISIAAALQLNALEGPPSQLTSVDIIDVNTPDGPWKSAGLKAPPRDSVAHTGFLGARFMAADAVTYLKNTTDTYDFIFLDGSHQAAHVYREVQLSQRILRENGVILLHDYFPDAKPLWPDSSPLPGPALAIARLKNEGAPIIVVPLGKLPWPTKSGTNITSLALLLKR